MKAQDIVRLLTEAMSIGLNNPIQAGGEIRLAEIQVEFQHAVWGDEDDDDLENITISATVRTILNALFVSTVEHRPERLIELYPVFDLLCGDRSSGWIGNIGWDCADLARTLLSTLCRRQDESFSLTRVAETMPLPRARDDVVRAALQRMKDMSCPTHHSSVLRPDGTRACGDPGCDWTLDRLGSEATNWMPPNDQSH